MDAMELYEPLIMGSTARTIFPFRPDLLPFQELYKYEVESEDIEGTYSHGDGGRRRSEFSMIPKTIQVPKIKFELGYEYEKLQQVEAGLLPYTDRTSKVAQKIANLEDRILFAGDPMFPSNAYGGVTDTTNISTAWGATVFNVTTAALARSTLGAGVVQLMNARAGNSNELMAGAVLNAPLFLTVNVAVYTAMMGVSNANTDRTLIQLITDDLIAYSGVGIGGLFVNDNLGATLDYDDDHVTATANAAGTALLNAYDENAFRVVHSAIDIREELSQIEGITTFIDERIVGDPRNNDSMIYEAGATIA